MKIELVFYAGNLVTPARRHCCDICKAVFTCHLCTIGEDHKIHTVVKQHANTKVFICSECCNEETIRFQPRNSCFGRVKDYTDMLTGKPYQTWKDKRNVVRS